MRNLVNALQELNMKLDPDLAEVRRLNVTLFRLAQLDELAERNTDTEK